MDKIDQLIVRACKSSDPDTRLESIIRRFYTTGSKTNELLLISLLSGIIDDYHPIKSHKLLDRILISALSEDGATMERKMYCALKYHIRWAEGAYFNMPITSRFSNA